MPLNGKELGDFGNYNLNFKLTDYLVFQIHLRLDIPHHLPLMTYIDQSMRSIHFQVDSHFHRPL